MQLIKGAPGVPFGGGINHQSQDGEATRCGLSRSTGDLVFADNEMHSVWTVNCEACFGPGVLRWPQLEESVEP